MMMMMIFIKFLEKLIVSQLVKEFHAFYGTINFLSLVTNAVT